MKPPALDPHRAALGQALGHCEAARRLLIRVPDCDGVGGALRGLARELAARLDNLPLQEGLALTAAEDPQPGKSAQARAEIEWRIQDTWRRHMAAYADFKRENSGLKLNGNGPLPDTVKKLIRDALLEYDKELLGPDQRDQWRRESRVRAAGVGIFFSPYHCGVFPDLPAGEKPQGYTGPYLEHDRPWRRIRGKADPILKFSGLYFEEKARRAGGEE